MHSNKTLYWAVGAMLMVLLGVAVWIGGESGESPPGNSTVLGRILRRVGFASSITPEPDSGRRRGGARATSDVAPDAQTFFDDVLLTCSLTGKVINEQQQPIKGARITVRGIGETAQQTFSSDENGQFSAASVQPGTYDILAEHPQYVTLIRPSFVLEPTAGTCPSILFQMPLGASIKGRVTDENGQAIGGVRVAARRRKAQQLPGGGAIFLDDASYRIDQSTTAGTFVIGGVSIGENLFEFAKPGYEQITRIVTIRPQTAKETMKIVLKKTGRISGIVIDENANPVSTVTVQLVRYKPLGRPSQTLPKAKFTTTTGASGRFHFGRLFTEGFYDITVENAGYAPGIFPLVASGTEALTCQLQRGGIIEGRAEHIDRPTTPASVPLIAETVIKGTTFTRQLKSNGAGNFRFVRLPYGKYRLYVDSVDIVSEPKNGVPCVRGKPTRNVVVEVFDASSVYGRVLEAENGVPIPNAEIVLTATYGTLGAKSRSCKAMTDGHGSFQFGRVPGGLHTVKASARNFIQTADAGSAQTFFLQPGQRKSDIALRLSRGGTVDGFVLDPRGRSVEGCHVQLYATPGTQRKINVKKLCCRTDGTGYFKIGGIDVGDRILMYASAHKPGLAKARGPQIDLTAKEPNATTQIVIPAGATVSGRVTDERSQPIPGVEVSFSSSEFGGDPSNRPLKAHTQADGSYALTECSPGNGSITVTGSGFMQQARSVALREGQHRDRIDFKLVPGRRISGRVASLDGKPIPNARVQASPLPGSRGNDADVTDSKGEYTLTNLGPGFFRLKASFSLPTSDGKQNYVFVVRRAESGRSRVDFYCDTQSNVSGLVTGEERKGVNNFRVSWRSRSDPELKQDFTFNLDRSYSNARGLFRVLRAPRGVYSLKVTADGYETYFKNDVFIGPGRQTVLPIVRLRLAGGVTGTVISSTTDNPVNNVTVKVSDATLPRKEANRLAVATQTDYLGNFRISTVPAGTLRVEFRHPNYQPLQLDQVSVFEKHATDLGTIALEAGGTIKGSVTDTDGLPVQWASVKVSGPTPLKRTKSDAAGNFLLQGVRAGRWPVVVEGTANSRKVYSFKTVWIEPDETETVNFVLDTGADLDGALALAEGQVRSGTVHIHPFDEYSNVLENYRYDGQVSAQKFSIKSVPPGQYFLWSTGFGTNTPYSVWREIFLNRGPNSHTLTIPAGLITGRVFGMSGLSMTGVSLQLLPQLDNLRLPQSIYNSLIQAAFSSDTGVFQFNYVQPGTYQLLYLTPSGAFAGQWMAMPQLSVGPNQQINNLDIVTGE